PQHPKNRRKDSSDKARHRLKNVAARQLLNKGRAAGCVPCAGAFASFARQKKGTEITAQNDCNQKLRAKLVFDKPLKFGTPSERE
ncbi:MAG: hypothetical protein J6V61_01395, partial [Bacteroidaceae bacterium]|nr:hypothetical protein [Bacteroidaceae bacterium]